MRNRITAVIATFILVLSGNLLAGVGCEEDSRSPEVYTFYGDPATILAKIDKVDMQLPERRMYMVVVEGQNGDEIRLFERSGKTNNFHVWSAKSKSIGSLNEKVSHAIIANRGVACVGEQTKAIVTKSVSPKDLGTVPAPVNGRAAFSHTISAATGFVRATVYLLC